MLGRMQVVTIDATLVWNVERTPSGNLVAACDEVGLTMQAESQDELASLIHEGLYALFADLLEDGELDAFLRARGWGVRAPLPLTMPEDGVQFDVPFRLERAA
jgi:hypothetical protein